MGRLLCLGAIAAVAQSGLLPLHPRNLQVGALHDLQSSQQEEGSTGLGARNDSREEGSAASTSAGVFFQHDGCPYSISEQEADDLSNRPSKAGNLISVKKFGVGRTGNRFESLSLVLSMGYCCRSRLVSLPREDEWLPSESWGAFQSDQRHFSFSQATLPSDVYMQLRDDPDACNPTLELDGDRAFYLSGFNQNLLDCMNDVYIRGCERAFLGPGLDKENICPKHGPTTKTGTGTLVMHIRSGDIMARDAPYHSYGQPPVQYYLDAIQEKNWEAVTILTWAMQDARLNPTYLSLEMMAKTGVLGQNVQLFRNRTMWEDLREMICADGLVMSRSSLSFPMIALSKAFMYVIPYECGPGTFRRANGFLAMDRYDNATLLKAEKPNAEVFGIEWDEGGAAYTVFQKWNASDSAKRMEMVLFSGIKKLKMC